MFPGLRQQGQTSYASDKDLLSSAHVPCGSQCFYTPEKGHKRAIKGIAPPPHCHEIAASTTLVKMADPAGKKGENGIHYKQSNPTLGC